MYWVHFFMPSKTIQLLSCIPHQLEYENVHLSILMWSSKSKHIHKPLSEENIVFQMKTTLNILGNCSIIFMTVVLP